MKALRSILCGLALLVCYGAALAKTNHDGRLTKTYAINTYIDAITRGRTANLNDVVDNSATFNMLRGRHVLSFDKKQMLDYLRKNQDIEQTCTTNTSIVENSPRLVIVKVDMKYENFVKSNYVTIANTGAGWKITNVYSVFN